ncbi:MAG: adenine phosphoribosyltransferase [Candidatus Margulisbacteria bacterium]|nr:adenine phosphoribosyltransferase [Candidatus Margulisiibacteriota bacterium]
MHFDLKSVIRDIPDFPKKGIVFKDITTLLKHPQALNIALQGMAAPFVHSGVNHVVGIESRGFMFGVSAAQTLKCGFVPIRKAGKLPSETYRVDYELEYGTSQLAIHKDAIEPGENVVIMDDLLATGGTMDAAIQLVTQCGGDVVGISCLIELTFLNGRGKLGNIPFHTLIQY